MSSKNKNKEWHNKLWAYVHDELPAEDRVALEDRLDTDSDLASELEDIRRTHADLRSLMPQSEQSEDDLVDTLLDAWERDQQRETPTLIEPLAQPHVKRKGSLVYGPFGVAISLAASLMVMLAANVYLVQPDALEWESMEIVQESMYRGADGKTYPPTYSRDQMTAFSAALREAVKESYERNLPPSERKRFLAKKRDWVMSAKLQELRNGKLGVHIKAFKRTGNDPAKQWNRYFSDSEIFLKEVRAYAEIIAAELVVMKIDNRVGGQS